MKTTWAALIILLAVFAMPAAADDTDKWIRDLEDPIPSVRTAAAEALGELDLVELGDTSAVKTLIKALEDEDSKVRAAAAEALGRLGDDLVELEDTSTSGLK